MDGVWCTLSEPLAPRVALGDAQGCILYILQTVLPATSVPGTNQENYGAYLLQYLRLLRWNRPSEGEAITREGGVYHSIPRTAPLKGQPVERASGG